jgi:alpha-galactosidase
VLIVEFVIEASPAHAVSRVAAKSIARAGVALTLLLLVAASCEGTSGRGAADASACALSDALAPMGDTGSRAGNDDSGARTALDGGQVDGREDAHVPMDAGSPEDAARLGVDPAMGWTSWSFIRQDPTEAAIEAQALALADSGLSSHGYTYVNLDDFYYLDPTTNSDSYGRWVVDATKFPDGMQAVASYVHDLGLEFGMYLTPGIPVAAVNQSTPIEGTFYNAANIAVSGSYETNYNFGGGAMLSIDYSKPGAQEFINSWANLLASYGVDYVKLDGVGAGDIPDVRAWSEALKSTGRPIHYALSNSLDLDFATVWSFLANSWRIEEDIECYCPASGSSSSYPLTSWDNVSARFGDDPPWQPFSGAGARNDLDSLELGNGDDDGISVSERQSHMSLWALAAAPLLVGADLTNLDSGDLALLTNDEVIAVDQAGVAAKQLTNGDTQVWVANEPDGSLAVGLFNLGGAPAPITVAWSDLGITGAADVRDLWAHADLGAMSGSFTANVSSHGVSLVRIQP